MAKINFKKTKGETLLETVIALTILAIGITMAGAVIGSSLTSMNAAKNRVIAVNLARQGIEAVRDIRDTNWLKFSNRLRACWNHMPQEINSETVQNCDNNLIAPVNSGNPYIVYLDKNYRWRLAPKVIESGSGADNSELFWVDIDQNASSDGDADKTNDMDIHNHFIDGKSLGSSVKKTPFKRWIEIGYITNNGGTDGDETSNRMLVTSHVEWIEKGNTFKTSLKTMLTDYLDRQDYN